MTVFLRKTEQHNPAYTGLHKRSTRDNLRAMYEGQVRAVQAIEPALAAMEAVIVNAVERLKDNGGRLIEMGAGTSGRLCVQDVIELKPTFGWSRVAYGLAGDDEALTRSVEGAEDDEDAARQTVAALDIGKNDVCFFVAASGRTPYTVAACEEARRRGALTVAIVNNRDEPLLKSADHAIFIDSGPEFLPGSTRMGAGTAQKSVLNMLSTEIMIKLGRVYDIYMVFVQATCEKLVERAQRTIMGITGCTQETATKAFNDAAALGDEERHVPTAILAAAGNIDVVQAQALLKAKKDHFPDAMKSLKLPDCEL